MLQTKVPDVLKKINIDVTEKKSHRNADSKNVPTPVSGSHTVVCGNDRLFDITKELFTKYNLSDKDISDIINVAQADFNKITKAHKVLVNYKKPINSIMGFLRDAILNNWEPDIKSTAVSTSHGTNDYYKRCGYSSWEEVEAAFINKSSA